MGIPVLFLGFIGTVFGIPASVIAIVQFMSPVVLKIRHSHASGPALKPGTAPVALDGATLEAANLNRYCRECRPSGGSQQRLSPARKAAYKRVIEERRRQCRDR
jgi:hypothetical protein